MPSTGTLVFNDQKLQAPEMYATESLGVGVSVPTSNLEVVGNAYVSSNLDVGGSLGLTKGSSLFAGDSVVMETSKHDRPLVKYPEVAMTVNAETASGYRGYKVTTNGNYSGRSGWEAFDSNPFGSSWATENGTYSHSGNGEDANTSGQTAGTFTANGISYTGHWIKLELVNAIKLQRAFINAYNSDSSSDDRRPKKGVFLGSNDDSVWDLVHAFDGDLGWGRLLANQYGATINFSNISTRYKYILLLVEEKQLPSSSSATRIEIFNIEFYGYEQGDVSTDVTLSLALNKPGTQQLEVYWDGADPNSYSGSGTTVNDLSGNGVTGTLANGVGFDSEYNAFTFDGSNDYISGSLATTTGAWVHSFSFWMNADTAGVGHFVALGAESTNNASVIRFNSQDVFQWYFWGNDLRFNAPNTLQRWVHVVGTYDGGNDSGVSAGNYGVSRKIFIDGKETTVSENVSGTAGTNPLNLVTTTTPFRVGSQLSGTAYFDGKIANVRVFSKKLSIDQIRELYAYEAVRFGRRASNSVSLHKGNLGVGVTTPTSRFEVAPADGVFEYPPRAMSGHDTYMEGHGVFKARWANWYSGNTPTGMYNKQNAVGGQTNIWYGPYTGQMGGNGTAYNGGDIYSGTDFAASTTGEFFLDDVNGNRYHGAWTTLEMPYDILLQRIHLYQGANSEGISSRCAPEDGVILGSANGHEWHHVHTFTGLQYGGTLGSYSFDAAGESVTVNATTPYKHYALVTTRTLHYAFTVIIGELIWFGTLATSTLDDGKLTLGKQLTTPRVSGHGVGSETPRAESLIAHFDTTVDSVKSGNTAVDTSGAGSNGTFEGNATYSSSDRAMRFDGTGDKVTASFPSSAGDNTFSVSFWMKRAANSATYCPFFLGDATTGEGIGMDIYTNGSVYWFIYGGKNFLWTGVTGAWFPVGAWTHVAASHTAGTDFVNLNKVWINGIDVSAGKGLNGPNTADLSLDANDTITLGARVGSNYLNGSISNFKIWGGVALTVDEVAAEYALGRTGKTLNVTDTAVCLGGTVPRAQLDVRGSMIVNDVVRQLNKPFFTCAPFATGALKAVGNAYQIYKYNSSNDALQTVTMSGAHRWRLHSIPLDNYLYGSRNVELVRVLDDTTSETSGVRVPYEGVYVLTQTARTTAIPGVTFWVYSASEAKYIQLSDQTYNIPWGGGASGSNTVSNNVSTMVYLKAGDIVIFVHGNGSYLSGTYEQHVALAML